MWSQVYKLFELTFPETINDKPKVKGRRKGERRGRNGETERKKEIESEALAGTEKNHRRPSRESNSGPRKTRLMLNNWATEKSDITSQFIENLSALPPPHHIGIIQCPQLTNPLHSGDPPRSPLCVTHILSLSPFPPLPFPSSSFPFPSPFDLSFALKMHSSHLFHWWQRNSVPSCHAACNFLMMFQQSCSDFGLTTFCS